MSRQALRTQSLHNLMTGWRQDLHAHPELGFHEHRLVEQQLAPGAPGRD